MTLEDDLKNLCEKIRPIDKKIYGASQSRWDSIAKPLGGLGRFEKIVSRLAACQKNLFPQIKPAALAVFCADNGIVAEGVSQTDSSVTKVVAENLSLGKASSCKIAAVVGADLFPVDAGIKEPVSSEKIADLHVRRGTCNFLRERAMSRSECAQTILRGAEFAKSLSKKGYKILLTGEMGIGNTTTSSAVLAALTGLDPAILTGKGAGLSDAGLAHKIEVIKKSLAFHKIDSLDVLDVLSAVGGLDIAMMTGFFLGGADSSLPLVVDGFISSVAALCASRLSPAATDYFFASHSSTEGGCKIALKEMGLDAVIFADMHLGEGTGGLMLLPLLESSLAVYKEMPTFEDIKIEAYKKL